MKFLRERLSLISGLDGDGCSTPGPGRLTLGKEIRYFCRGEWVVPRTSLDEYGKPCPRQNLILGPYNP